VNNKNFKHLLLQHSYAKFLQGKATVNGPLWVVPQLPQQMQDGGRRPYCTS